MNRKRTKLLIVDDSRIFRNAIQESLVGEDDIEVVGSVWNGVKAMEFIRSTRPDIVTLDVEMPDMDGLETLEAIEQINASSDSDPIGVVMLSSHTQRGADITVKALEMGAFDFIPKPQGKDRAENIRFLRRQLLVKIRYFASKRVSPPPAMPQIPLPMPPEPSHVLPVSSSRIKAVLIGASTGGPKALLEMLPSLCEKVAVPIFIVQHMPPTFTQSLAKSLDAKCRHSVMEGRSEDLVRERHVYVAPGGRHMLLRKRNQTVRTVVNDHPPERGYKPSVDVLFRSGAAVYGGDVIAVVLTGMGNDGTRGAGILQRAGAFVIAQDKETSVVWGMPRSVSASGQVDQVLPLYRIPQAITTRMAKSRQE